MFFFVVLLFVMFSFLFICLCHSDILVCFYCCSIVLCVLLVVRVSVCFCFCIYMCMLIVMVSCVVFICLLFCYYCCYLVFPFVFNTS